MLFDAPPSIGGNLQRAIDEIAAAEGASNKGPGGGPDGGRIVAAGTPEDVARAPGSPTGPWLAEHLGLPEAAQPPSGSRRRS